MNGNQNSSPALLKLVTWFMTPFAVLLVVLGVIYGRPEPVVGNVCIGIILFTGIINALSAMLIKKNLSNSALIRNSRVAVNYALNILLIYLLLPVWPDIWLLLLLMAVATALYDNLKATYIYCGAFALVLICLALWTDQFKGIQAGQTLVHAAMIAALGPFINQLAHLSKSLRSS